MGIGGVNYINGKVVNTADQLQGERKENQSLSDRYAQNFAGNNPGVKLVQIDSSLDHLYEEFIEGQPSNVIEYEIEVEHKIECERANTAPEGKSEVDYILDMVEEELGLKEEDSDEPLDQAEEVLELSEEELDEILGQVVEDINLDEILDNINV